MWRRVGWLMPIVLVCSACSGGDQDLPRAYRSMAVPEAGLRSESAVLRGKRLYDLNCALCHGVGRDGQGARRIGLSTPPRNFTDQAWQRSTTPRRLFFVIREGVPGTAMAAWRSLSAEETWDLVAYLRAPAD